ncbi:MAG: substrate-binding domain-containing protein [bacterium]
MNPKTFHSISFLFMFFSLVVFNNQSFAKQKLILTSTTSTLDSGLFDVLIPAFEKKYDCSVKVIAVGTGQAIRLAKDGNADVLLVHDRVSEEQFVQDGYGIKRLDVMHNDFLIVGPKNDPAGIKEDKALNSFKKIYQSKTPFVSRGDDSGTHKKELNIWKQLNIKPSGDFYIESGTGMEMTLRIAQEKNAYCLVDRATWLSHKKEIDVLEILVEGDSILYNPYSVIVVSPTKFPRVNFKLAQKFADFIRSYEGQKIIKNFGIKKFGEPLYFPDVVKF